MTLLALAVTGLLLQGGRPPASAPDTFDHARHRKVFPECTGCHPGAIDPARPLFPAPVLCAACHDGVVERRVSYVIATPRPSNFRFTHAMHAERSGAKLPADSVPTCASCHIPDGAAWLTVRRPIQSQCFACHGIRTAHFSAPDSTCAKCHLSLAEATALPPERVAAFGRPAWHDDPGFRSAQGHGARADRGDRSCVVCHARDFCVECHVNAPEVRAIQAMAPDPRSLALHATLQAPASHSGPHFPAQHGASARRDVTRCAFCHTQESCIACHRTPPPIVRALPDSGPGRGPGARIDPTRLGQHGPDFADHHGPTARARPASCEACHARAECLECHRPDPGSSGSYHPSGFLTRHPAAAYNRQTDCGACHNQGALCRSCHESAGLVSPGRLQPGFHDVSGAFALNHGVAARQNIESCVTCHTERDCLACHSAQAGRHFDPHGPGFDAERLRRRNPQTCAACHGRNIPGG